MFVFYVCIVYMSAGKSEMLIFISVFFPTVVLTDKFPRLHGKKQKKMLVCMEYVCM